SAPRSPPPASASSTSPRCRAAAPLSTRSPTSGTSGPAPTARPDPAPRHMTDASAEQPRERRTTHGDEGSPIWVGRRQQEGPSVELLRERLIAVLAHEVEQQRVLLLVGEQKRRVELGLGAKRVGAERAELRRP